MSAPLNMNGVRPNELFSVSMWLQQNNERVDIPGAELGIGFSNGATAAASARPNGKVAAPTTLGLAKHPRGG